MEKKEQKTLEQEAIKDLVDPSPILTSIFPRDINELVQKMMHNYVCFFDNISFILPCDSILRDLPNSIQSELLFEPKD